MEVVTNLPEDILFEVIRRLPKTSRRRLEAVSKTWRDLIIKEAHLTSSNTRSLRYSSFVVYGWCSTDITLYHQDANNSNNGGLITRRQESIPFLLLKPNRLIHSMGSCNGVLFYSTVEFGGFRQNFHVYNPLTDQISTLPDSPFRFFQCDNDDESDCIGFALDEKSSHYKFVALHELAKNNRRNYKPKWVISIFDSEKGGWKRKPAKFRPYPYRPDHLGGLPDSCGVYMNGVIYWIDQGQGLLAFFVEDEVFRLFRLPETKNTWPGQRAAVWESEEGLKYGQICKTDGLSIWVLHHPQELIGHTDDDHHCSSPTDDQNNGWRLIFRVSYETLNAKFDRFRRKSFNHELHRVSAFDEKLRIVHIKTSQGFVSYNIQENTVSLLREYYDKFTCGYVFVLPFTYRWIELPSFGSGRNSRRGKRKIQDDEQAAAQPLRRSNRIMSRLRSATDPDQPT